MDMTKQDDANKQHESSLQKKLRLLRQKCSIDKKSFEETMEGSFNNDGLSSGQEVNQCYSGNNENSSITDEDVAPKTQEETSNKTEIDPLMPDLENIEDAKKEQEELPPQDAEVTVSVDIDKMSAYMVVTPPLNGGEEITAQMIMDALTVQKICYGINLKEINSIVSKKQYNHEVKVADGTPPYHGKNGEIVELKLRDTKQKVHTREDGTIDFKNLGAVNTIKEGERILKIIPPEEGIDGKNIYGKVLRGKHGKKARVEKGENTVITDDGEFLVASSDGDLKYTRNRFSVSKIFVVKGNLDNTVGNIEFIGDVEIKGDVMEGYSVTAKGHVNIGGMVEGASITAGGNINIRNGINGMGSGQLYAGGEVRCKFIENCTVIAKKDIYAESIINSRVSSHGSLNVAGKRGAIIGGRITIQNQIEAKLIGSQSNVPTEITLGAPPEMLEKRFKLKSELNTITKKISSIDKDINYLLTVEENRGLTPQRKKQLSQLKISKPLEKMRCQRVQKLIEEINEIINNDDKCKLTCNTIYPAVKISIRDSVMITKVVDHKCIYMYIDGEVKKLQG